MYDFIVVGSGVSGGRIAAELVNGGAKVALLEAGRHFQAKTFPKNEMDYSSQLFWGGGIELSSDGALGFLRAKCVGGTSIVNQALWDEFDDSAWDEWRDLSGIKSFNSKTYAPLYDEIRSNTLMSEIPTEHFNRNTKLFIDAFEKKKFGWKVLNRGQKDCALEHGTDCIVCLGGCPRDSKQSSWVASIRPALQRGLTLLADFEVQKIDHRGGDVTVTGFQSQKLTSLRAKRVVLAAGALGNTTLLLKSLTEMGGTQNLPAIGTRFSCHPQFMTYAVFDEKIDAHKGAFQAVKSYDPKLRKAGFKLENVFAQPIGTAMLLPGFGNTHQRLMKKYRNMASIEVALRDDASGVVKLGSNGRPMIHKSLTSDDRKKAKAGLKLVRELFESLNAQEIISCKQGFGLHLMGGCPIGTDPKTSVVDPEFQVHGMTGVYAADSSIFPSAPGINPSFTIMANSLLAARNLLKM